MPVSKPLRSLVAAALCALAVAIPTSPPALAQTAAAQNVARGPSGLPLPRFVSLKSGRVNSRIGPGLNYAVDWMYLKPGLPMEIIQEYDNWRRVRDSDGAEGWINQSLLSGKRSGIAAPWFKGKEAMIPMRAEPAEDARLVASIEPGAMGEIETCNGTWCQMRFDSYRGWVPQNLLWGAYPNETIDD